MGLVEVFGRRVREVRLQKGWTQEQLALEARVKRAYLSEVESGKRAVSLPFVEKIALALECDPAELLRG
jgi:transcriptional regulator with XRE-family HTH domain